MFEKTNVSQEFFEKQAKEILDSVLKVLVEKNKMYSGASFDLGLVGNYVHLHDKENRIKSLIEKMYAKQEISFESIEDSYRDLIGYSVIGLIILNSEKKGVEDDEFTRQANENFNSH